MLENEEDYKDIINHIKELDAPYPEDLDDRIAQRIDGLKKPKRPVISIINKIAAVFIITFIGLTALIYLNKDFAAFAATVPGLDVISRWIYQDLGVQNAHDNGYPDQGVLTFEKDGFQLTLSNIMIDEEGISFIAMISSDQLPEYESQKIIGLGELPANQEAYYDFNVELRFSSSFNSIDVEEHEKALAKNYYYIFNKEGYIKDLINNTGELPFTWVVYYYENNETKPILMMENLTIPVDDSHVLLSKHYLQDQELSFGQGTIKVKELIVAPMRMQLKVESFPGEGYQGIDLGNVYLKDNKGNVYLNSGGGISKMGGNVGEADLFFAPSVYFDEEIETLTLCYDNYHYSYPQEPYQLVLAGPFPQYINYHGIEIPITSMKHDGKDLTIQWENPNTGKFYFQWLEFEPGIVMGSTSASIPNQLQESEGLYSMICENVLLQDVYQVTYFQPMFIVEEKGEIQLLFK